MKFGKQLHQNVLPILSGDPRYACLRASIICYKGLKQILKRMDFDTFCARGTAPLDECCGICLDPLAFRWQAIRTACGHHFHPHCLVDAFAVRTSRGACPMCRTPLGRLVPAGVDGDVLRFLATVRVGIEAADTCYEGFVRYLQGSINLLIASMAEHRRRPVWFTWMRASLQDQLTHRASELCAHLAAARAFAVANRDGVRKIVKKFERRAQLPAPLVSTHITETWLEGRGFARDAQVGGRLGEMRRRLGMVFGRGVCN